MPTVFDPLAEGYALRFLQAHRAWMARRIEELAEKMEDQSNRYARSGQSYHPKMQQPDAPALKNTLEACMLGGGYAECLKDIDAAIEKLATA